MNMTTMTLAGLALSGVFAVTATSAYAAQWTFDPNQTKVEFKVKGVGGTDGSFSKFQGTAHYVPDNIEAMKIDFTIDSNSLNAGAKTALYKGENVFNVDDYPSLKFRSTKVTAQQGNQVKVDGLLTMHGVTKPVSWNMQIDPARSSNDQLYFDANTTIARSNWGMNGYSKLASDQVKLSIKAKLDTQG